jgi:hypothetical protein
MHLKFIKAMNWMISIKMNLKFEILISKDKGLGDSLLCKYKHWCNKIVLLI